MCQIIVVFIVLVWRVIEVKYIIEVNVERIIDWVSKNGFICSVGSDGILYQLSIGSIKFYFIFDVLWINVIRWYYVIVYNNVEVGFVVDIVFQCVSCFEVLCFQVNIEKSGWIFIYLVEGEMVNDFIFWNVCIIIDVNFVVNVFFEGEIVRFVVGQFSWNVIGNDGYGIGIIRVLKGV